MKRHLKLLQNNTLLSISILTIIFVIVSLIIGQNLFSRSDTPHVHAAEELELAVHSALQGPCVRWTPVSSCYPFGSADGRFELFQSGASKQRN